MGLRSGKLKVNNKYAQGNYLIKGFDMAGGKLFTKKAESQNMIGAQHEGISLCNQGQCASFVVIRVMYNNLSKDRSNWE